MKARGVNLLPRRMLPAIYQAVRREEKIIARHIAMLDGSIEEELVYEFRTDAPNSGIYHATPDGAYLQHLDHLGIRPGTKIAILGSGVGLDMFEGATKGEVTGYETDPMLLLAANRIRDEFSVANVRVRARSFLSSCVDLSQFGVVSFYIPFSFDFDALMGAKLQTCASGTIVTSWAYTSATLFDPRYFRQYQPSHRQAASRSSDFHDYIRR